jgi:hypothetical protein
MEHNTTGKFRFVMRNQIGKVQLNVGVGKGMDFVKVGGKQSSVRFMAPEDVGADIGQWMLKVKPDNLDKFHAQLQKMAA